MNAMANAEKVIATMASEPIEYIYKNFGDFTTHFDTIFITWILIALTIILCIAIGNKFSAIPNRIQVCLEAVYEFFEELAIGLGGEKMKKYLPWVLSFFFFIVLSNLWGLLPGLPIKEIDGKHILLSMPPTRDLNTTLALAVLAFFSFQVIGYKEGGIKYLLHYLHPLPAILPGFPKIVQYILFVPLAIFFITLNIIEELARVLSLTMRLMGNILGEHIVAGVMIGLIYISATFATNMLTGVVIAAGTDIFAFILQFMGALTGVIQGFVFTLLTMSYIGSAINFED